MNNAAGIREPRRRMTCWPAAAGEWVSDERPLGALSLAHSIVGMNALTRI